MLIIIVKIKLIILLYQLRNKHLVTRAKTFIMVGESVFNLKMQLLIDSLMSQ